MQVDSRLEQCYTLLAAAEHAIDTGDYLLVVEVIRQYHSRVLRLATAAPPAELLLKHNQLEQQLHRVQQQTATVLNQMNHKKLRYAYHTG